LTFLFDANFPVQLGRALKELGRAPHEFRHVDLEPSLGRGATDEAVIEAAGSEGWFLVSLDKGIVKNPAKRSLLFEKGVGAFSFTGSAIGTWGYYQTVSFVMSIVEEMFDLAERTPRPFIFGITDKKKFRVLGGA
jgi:hypothetical protein